MENKNIYVDMLCTNKTQTKPNERVQVKFFADQLQPILKDTTGYRIAVNRFSLNTETLPIFIPEMLNETDTIYSCTMEYNGQIFQRYMHFEPQNTNPLDEDEHFYVYSYQYVVYLMNNMLQECLVGLNNINNTNITTAPEFTFDINNKMCSLQLGCN